MHVALGLVLVFLGFLHHTIGEDFRNTRVDISTYKEAKVSIQRGIDYLLTGQQKNGSWSARIDLTALCLIAIFNSHEKDFPQFKKAIEKGCGFIRKHVRELIRQKRAANHIHIASLAFIALYLAENKNDRRLLKDMFSFLIASLQHSTDYSYICPKGNGNLFDINWALEALLLGRNMLPLSEYSKSIRQEIRDSQRFISACQRKNKYDYPYSLGSFMYSPLQVERAALTKHNFKSAGTISSALTSIGVDAFLYTGLSPSDARILTGFKKLRRNYLSLLNPKQKKIDLYLDYFYLAKVFTRLDKNRIHDAKGIEHNWRQEIIHQLLSCQGSDGQWQKVNRVPNSAYHVALSTAYAILTLEIALLP